MKKQNDGETQVPRKVMPLILDSDMCKFVFTTTYLSLEDKELITKSMEICGFMIL